MYLISCLLTIMYHTATGKSDDSSCSSSSWEKEREEREMQEFFGKYSICSVAT